MAGSRFKKPDPRTLVDDRELASLLKAQVRANPGRTVENIAFLRAYRPEMSLVAARHLVNSVTMPSMRG